MAGFDVPPDKCCCEWTAESTGFFSFRLNLAYGTWRQRREPRSMLYAPHSSESVSSVKMNVERIVIDSKSAPHTKVVRVEIVAHVPIGLSEQLDHLNLGYSRPKESPFEIVNHAGSRIVTFLAAVVPMPNGGIKLRTFMQKSPPFGPAVTTRRSFRQTPDGFVLEHPSLQE